MLKSKLIPMIKEGKQQSVANLAIAYVYGVGDGAATGAHGIAGTTPAIADAAQILFYGHDKNGPVFIAKGHLVTDATYTKGEAAACVITDIPIKDDYAYLSWELSVPSIGNFVRIESQPQMGTSVSEMTEHLSVDTKEYADTTEADA